MHATEPTATRRDVPPTGDGPTDHATPRSTVTPSNDPAATAADRGLDWAALAGIAEYESWLRQLG